MSGDAGHREPVGSVGEEAVKLLGAVQDWAQQHGGEYAAAASDLADSLGDAVEDLDAHVATGGEDCRYCPVCQGIALVRQTTPEVRRHLGDAAGSLFSALAAALASDSGPADRSREKHDVQRITLDDDPPAPS